MTKNSTVKLILGCAGLTLLIASSGMTARGKKEINGNKKDMHVYVEKKAKIEHKKPVASEHKKPIGIKYKKITRKDCALHNAMRRLWVDHAVWTHDYLIFATHDIAAAYKKASAERLLKNQDDIGDAIVPFYGEEAGKKLATLLREHITIAIEVVEAIKSGDKKAFEQADKKWHDNAKDIAAFLHKANPKHWPEDALVAMLNKHLALTGKEAVALIENRWDDLIALYDQVITQLMHMSDALAAGIVKQFPEKFDYHPIRKTVKKAVHMIREKMHLPEKAVKTGKKAENKVKE